MNPKRYIIEAIGSFLLTLVLLLTSNPIAVSFLWSTLLFVRGKTIHGYYNSALTSALYAAGYLPLRSALFLGIAQMIGSFTALACFGIISGAPFLPDASTTANLPLLGCIEGLSALLLCLTTLIIHTHKESESVVHQLFILSTAFLALQSIGAVINPSFGCSVFLNSFLEIQNSTFLSSLHTNFQYSLSYSIIPTAAGLCVPYIKKWIDKAE